MSGGLPERLLHVTDAAVHRARDIGRAGGQRKHARADRPVGRAHGRRLRHFAQLARRRVLALREPVDPVVEEQDRDVDVAPEHVQQVVAADRQAVSVPRDHEDLELGPGELEPGRQGRGAAVDGVEAVGVHVVREAARAADARDEHDVLSRDAEIGHRLLHRAQDGVVPAAGAPAHVLVGLEVLLRVLRRRAGSAGDRAHCFASRS